MMTCETKRQIGYSALSILAITACLLCFGCQRGGSFSGKIRIENSSGFDLEHLRVRGFEKCVAEDMVVINNSGKSIEYDPMLLPRVVSISWADGTGKMKGQELDLTKLHPGRRSDELQLLFTHEKTWTACFRSTP